MSNYQLVDSNPNVKTIYRILTKRNIAAFKSYDSEHYYFYDLEPDENVPIYVGLLLNETEVIRELFKLERGMYGVAARKVIVMLIDAMRESPEYIYYVNEIAVDDLGGAVGKLYLKFILWLLTNKLRAILAQENPESRNVKLCCSKIRQTLAYLGINEMEVPIINENGLTDYHQENWFRLGDIFKSLVDDPTANMPPPSEDFADIELSKDFDSSPVAVLLS